jgi:sugar phosphate isomerase/epimerase
VGFCWDSGHEKCYNHDQDLLALFGDRLLVTHLNDNLGISDPQGEINWLDDLHLLPYDGMIDWEYNMQRLNRCRPLPYLNCELLRTSKPGRTENDQYANMPLDEYFKLAYARAKRLAEGYAL